jgi:hypothetical protein
MDFEKEPLDFEENEKVELYEEPTQELTKSETRDSDPQYFTNIDGVFAKDVAGRAAVEELRMLVDSCSYSTSERVIGTWIDGSDLYQRTFTNVELPNNNAWNNSVLGTTGINILKVDGFIKTEFASDTAVYYPLFYFRESSNYSTFVISDSDLDVYLHLAIPSGAITPLTATITIQYTKPVVNNLSNNIQTVSKPNEEPTEGEDMRSEPVEEEIRRIKND